MYLLVHVRLESKHLVHYTSFECIQLWKRVFCLSGRAPWGRPLDKVKIKRAMTA